MIIEGLLTSARAAPASPSMPPHIAAMGPVVNPELTQWKLRPFQTSTTFRCLQANPYCVFHVTDDVLPVVEAALGLPCSADCEPLHLDTPQPVWLINSACRWYCLKVVQWDLSQLRSEAVAEVIGSGDLRPFWGWNRAKHAVLEAAILASRLHLADCPAIDDDLAKLEVIVDKTAGPREHQAWELVRNFVRSHVK